MFFYLIRKHINFLKKLSLFFLFMNIICFFFFIIFINALVYSYLSLFNKITAIYNQFLLFILKKYYFFLSFRKLLVNLDLKYQFWSHLKINLDYQDCTVLAKDAKVWCNRFIPKEKNKLSSLHWRWWTYFT